MSPEQDDADRLEPSAPSMDGRRFALNALVPVHYPVLYALAMDDSIAFRWRHRGRPLSFEEFVKGLNVNVLCQFVVTPVKERKRVAGLVVAYNANLVNGSAYVAVLGAPNMGVGALEGLVLFVRYLFAYWPFRKLYVELPEYNLHQFEGAIRVGLLREEGRLKEEVYFRDRRWDYLTLTITRDMVRRNGPYLRSIGEGSPRDDSDNGDRDRSL